MVWAISSYVISIIIKHPVVFYNGFLCQWWTHGMLRYQWEMCFFIFSLLLLTVYSRNRTKSWLAEIKWQQFQHQVQSRVSLVFYFIQKFKLIPASWAWVLVLKINKHYSGPNYVQKDQKVDHQGKQMHIQTRLFREKLQIIWKKLLIWFFLNYYIIKYYISVAQTICFLWANHLRNVMRYQNPDPIVSMNTA